MGNPSLCKPHLDELGEILVSGEETFQFEGIPAANSAAMRSLWSFRNVTSVECFASELPHRALRAGRMADCETARELQRGPESRCNEMAASRAPLAVPSLPDSGPH